jgi:hypothetical protein
MSLMQALFTRCGQPIPMRVEKFDYLFTENVHGHFVCRVASEDHVAYMEETGNFERYTPPTREQQRAALLKESETWADEIVADTEAKIDEAEADPDAELDAELDAGPPKTITIKKGDGKKVGAKK